MESSARPSVPALARGIDAVCFLTREGPATLDAVARGIGAPRTSVFRILETLCQAGLVRKERGRAEYEAAVLLVPLQDPGVRIRRARRTRMETLASSLRRTAEWYVPSEAGMVLVERSEPPGEETWIVARIGFVRPWEEELDAVAAVAYAFRRPEGADLPARAIGYVSDGVKEPITARTAAEQVEQARTNRFAVDPCWNGHGVRRMAAPVVTGGRMRGVLALAEHRGGADRPGSEEAATAVREAAEALSGESLSEAGL